ncbi:Hypothetical protein R9X50_00303900 [Acrodontium crateriforme]|uniref:Proline iminopeptidase n=1 Tax=Acrodontium crateriforme TaxID=150365 RepID=A0AAQ3R3Y2_9PEZI|nr:Hypothetical protein R9X50_00303900 [Acrodontium crateriforme]
MASTAGYAHSDAFDQGCLQVGEIHNLYYAQYGKPNGKPVIFVHGGPGAAAGKTFTCFFNPDVYRVVMLDQRGAGKSTPFMEIRENTTQLLIQDFETLRERLSIPKWHMVFGGSWGSTLAIAYAEAHPDMVGSLVLRGVWLSRDLDDQDHSVRRHMFPEDWEAVINYLPEAERSNPYLAYCTRLLSGDQQVALEAAKVWNRWVLIGGSLEMPKEDPLWLLENEDFLLSCKITAHYFLNSLFLEKGQLLRDVKKIQHIPTSIIHGRYDVMCPPKGAWDLHKALPQSNIFFNRDSGHATMDPGNFKKLLEVCDAYGADQF